MFRRNVALTLFSDSLVAGLNLLTGVLLARAMSASDRGVLLLAMSLPWMAAGLASLGLPQAIIYLAHHAPGPSENRSDHPQHAAQVFGSGMLLSLAFGLLGATVLAVLTSLLLGKVFKGLPAGFWPFLLALVPLLTLDQASLAILRARQRFDLYNLRQAALPVVLLAGFGAAFWLGRQGNLLTAALSVYVVATGVMVFLGLLLAFHSGPVRFGLFPHLARRSLRFGLKSYLQNLLGLLHYRVDVYLVAFFLNPEQVAYYGVATAIAEAAWLIPDAIGNVLFPHLAQSPIDQIHAITARVARSTLSMVGLAAAALLGAGWLLVPLLYGASYRAAVPALIGLLPGILSMAVYKVLTRLFTSQDRQQITILTAGSALALNMALNLLLIPRWGPLGAAVSSSLSYTVAGLALLVPFLRESGLHWADVLILRPADLSGHARWLRQILHRAPATQGLEQ